MAKDDKNSESGFRLFNLRRILAGNFLDGARDRISEIISGTATFISDTQMAAGDQRIEHAPHPVDVLQETAADKLESFVHPAGDMNLAHAPHPVENIENVISKKMADMRNSSAEANTQNIGHFLGELSADLVLLYGSGSLGSGSAGVRLAENALPVQLEGHALRMAQQPERPLLTDALKTVEPAADTHWNAYAEMPGTGAAGRPPEMNHATLGWSECANLLGTGVYRPAPRLKRDFSDWMSCNAGYRSNAGTVNYAVDEHNKVGIQVFVRNDRMSYVIQAQDNCPTCGYGDELFMSSFKVLHQHELSVTAIDACWDNTSLYTTNTKQYMDALKSGLPPEQAAARTFTGRMAADIGLTKVLTDPEKPLSPVFKHPDWGAEQQMNEYSLAYARAHGRASIDVKPRPDLQGGLPTPIAQDLINFVYGLRLSEYQRRYVLNELRNTLSSHHDEVVIKHLEQPRWQQR